MITPRRIKRATKPFWMPTVALVYFLTVEVPDLTVIAALLFGMAGDILLMFPRKRLFVCGMMAFLAGHILYTAVFIGSIGGPAAILDLPVWTVLFIIPYAGYIIFLKKALGSQVASIFCAAASYISVILIMSLASLLRFSSFSGPAFLLPFIGSLLFILSDTLIGYRNFKRKFRYMDLIVTLTYLAAQILIVSGLALS